MSFWDLGRTFGRNFWPRLIYRWFWDRFWTLPGPPRDAQEAFLEDFWVICGSCLVILWALSWGCWSWAHFWAVLVA